MNPLSNSGPRRYRVLMIAPTMFFADYGSHVRILEEAVSLRDLGHDVTILAYPNGRDVAGLRVLRCWGVPFNYRVIVGSSRHKFYLDTMLSLRSLPAMFQVKPNLIHAHLHEGALIGAVLGQLWGVPLLFDFQGSLTGEMVDHHFISPESVSYRHFRWLENQINHLADAVITSSHNAQRLLCNDFHCRAEQVRTISDCVNPNTFCPGLLSQAGRAALRAEYDIPAQAQVVVYLGLLADYQGTPHLLQAARQVIEQRPDTFFLVFGFPGVPLYQEMAHSLGIAHRVRLPGSVPYEQAPLRLALGDVAVAPKLSATEGAGKILNYMAMGLPTVAFDTPVSREYLGEYGLYAERGNVDSLADKLLVALQDPAAAQRRGELGRKRILEHYTWRQGAQQIVEVYDQICQSRVRSLAARRVPVSRPSEIK